MNVVDSSAWLACFSKEPGFEFFVQVIQDTQFLIVPTVCLCEVFRVFLREYDETTALEATATMRQGTLVELDAELALDAALLGHQNKLSLADSIIYATARRYQAELWTRDAHFKDLPGVRYQPKEV